MTHLICNSRLTGISNIGLLLQIPQAGDIEYRIASADVERPRGDTRGMLLQAGGVNRFASGAMELNIDPPKPPARRAL